MKIAAIISEYNPFHNGHKYQVEKIREELGEDTAIIAIMSGNYTQRGEPAIADKTVRARAAVECGVNLILELPFPYSLASAEFYAKSGVHIANKLGVVDYLVFGSESGDIDELCTVAENMLTEKFQCDVLATVKSHTNLGYPKLCELAYKKTFGDKESNLFQPNNILALEYIKALKAEKSKIIPVTIKRKGAGYSDSLRSDTTLQSASAIRELMKEDYYSALEYIPKNAKTVFSEAISNNHMPSDAANLDAAVISFFRLNPPSAKKRFHDAQGGLYNRLFDLSQEAATISSLTEMAETKKYTKARIRRAIWYSYLGVTSSDVRSAPRFTQVLAMDGVGRSVLKRIPKMRGFNIFTKPSATMGASKALLRQKALSAKADSVYSLMLKKPNSGRFSLTFTPYVKK